MRSFIQTGGECSLLGNETFTRPLPSPLALMFYISGRIHNLHFMHFPCFSYAYSGVLGSCLSDVKIKLQNGYFRSSSSSVKALFTLGLKMHLGRSDHKGTAERDTSLFTPLCVCVCVMRLQGVQISSLPTVYHFHLTGRHDHLPVF